MQSNSDLGHFVLYVVKDKSTNKMTHIGKFSNLKKGERIKESINAESEIYEEVGTYESLSKITSEMRYLKIRSNSKLESYKKPRKSRVNKQSHKKSQIGNLDKNYFIDYKLINGTYEVIRSTDTDYS